MEKCEKIIEIEVEKKFGGTEGKTPEINRTTSMEIEDETKCSKIDEKHQKENSTESSVELNNSSSTYYSNTNKSMNNSLDKSINKKDSHKIIFKIDKINNNKKNNFFKLEYLNEIYLNLILDEKKANLKIDYGYMKNQSHMNEQMRAILVDWLIEVHHRFYFKRKTLFQTIYIIDLYLSHKTIKKEHLQLLGVASLLISAKENEIIYPSLEQFINITDNAYQKSELLKMEIHILQTLDFEILMPTAEEFYNILSKKIKFDKLQHHLGEYFLDSSLIDYNMLKYKQSTIGLSCIYIVMKFYGLNGYKDLYTSKFILCDSSQKQIKECAKDLCYLVKKLSKSYLKATREKYSLKEYDSVTFICEEK